MLTARTMVPLLAGLMITEDGAEGLLLGLMKLILWAGLVSAYPKIGHLPGLRAPGGAHCPAPILLLLPVCVHVSHC